jgi:hypothetical protein
LIGTLPCGIHCWRMFPRRQKLGLTDAEKSDLVEFLKSL